MTVLGGRLGLSTGMQGLFSLPSIFYCREFQVCKEVGRIVHLAPQVPINQLQQPSALYHSCFIRLTRMRFSLERK